MKLIKSFRNMESGLEHCFNIETSEPLTSEELELLRWILAETFEPDGLAEKSFFDSESIRVIELGPRMNFETAASTNRVAICHAAGLKKVTRVEVSRRHTLPSHVNAPAFIAGNHDRMTEEHYAKPLTTFDTGVTAQPVFSVPLIEQGPEALQKVNAEMGLGMDDWDVEFYYKMFAKDIGQDPTIVECFQLGQANSEHCRHWFFNGQIVIDGTTMPRTLMEVVKATIEANDGNSVIAFYDNSSAIQGYDVFTIVPQFPWKNSKFQMKKITYHLIFTAETHNFPTGKSSIPGSGTGTGGRNRDNESTGRGGLLVAGTCGFCVGNLNIPGYHIPGEDDGSWQRPDDLESPLSILLGEITGAYGYGNRIGEPVIAGFTRTFGLYLPNGERREWLKPIMFTGGLGQMDARHAKKDIPEKGMLIIQIGGPAYRIGVGGGSASSMIQGANTAELDFTAVQRGDAQMGNKLMRVVRACVDMGDKNPIRVIHDQGAGGPCNVLTELVEPAGGRIKIRNITLGDTTLSVLEIWSAEYQERNGILLWPDRLEEFQTICRREKLNCEVLGEVTGDGRIVVFDEQNDSTPVDLSLKKILSDMPQKTFEFTRVEKKLKPFVLPHKTPFKRALEMVMALPSVGSKEALLHRVDRSVTGLIVQQSLCGPVQLPVADFGAITQSHFGLTGGVTAIGEQPIKMLVDEAAGARMAVGEMLTNMAWARISALANIKISANWMWAAKLEGEGAALYDAAIAAEKLMITLGIAIDGGKDSLSMAAKVGDEVVKAPGELVISGYCTMPDITRKVTPDIKKPGQSKLMLIDLSPGNQRLGGSALAQAFGQIGDESPDVNDPEILGDAFKAIQLLIERKLILSGHDRSDGGLITCLLEMAFAGDCGLKISLSDYLLGSTDLFKLLFNEELGLVIEYEPQDRDKIARVLNQAGLKGCHHILGKTLADQKIDIRHSTNQVLLQSMPELRDQWRETSFQIDALQANPETVAAERKNTFEVEKPRYQLTFTPEVTATAVFYSTEKPKVAIIREEGTNGDREMASAFYAAGFETWDVTMSDILEGRVKLQDFRGIAFPGGFSFADVFDAGKGWAAVIKFNEVVAREFRLFAGRTDTFILGVCNGCQLMSLLGLVPWDNLSSEQQPRFIRNKSRVFESRLVTLRIDPSSSIFLTGMEESQLGVIIAHGEGQFYCPDDSILSKMIEQGCVPIRYVDRDGHSAEGYPFNPNGSTFGIAGMTSLDGRFLAMMPHPERMFLPWQWPYWPQEWQELKASPWLKLFQNARAWCDAN